MLKISGEKVPHQLKRVIHLGSRSYGRMTAAARLLPSFLLCGGQRCGSTSLYRALSSHPAILKPVLHKGVHYFDTNYRRGLSWYRGHFPTRLTAKRVSDGLGLRPMVFESSPYYLYHPLAAERFARDLPGVKLIVLVRDPVERAYSHHAHEVARGFEPILDFRAALDAEPKRLYGQDARLRREPDYYSFSHQHHGYLSRGEYAVHLERVAGIVGRERILVIDSHDFFTEPGPTYDRVLGFLGLPSLHTPAFGKHNARPDRPSMTPELRDELDSHFRPHDEALSDWLGHTPSWRR
ncbi:hypothetical protein Afil01_57650 [Actinorhabdospora filicis]|uniref:Sulfotransferase domain-containing protein n=1 Tax=Actinorhabdospora filicis TaxID=1785913 RepID=A0A9W6SRD9_9ACTN|nr:hypothetical protein Afil01_57650 [Actinorhabdospora filicis]